MSEGKFQYAGELPEVEVEGFGIEEAKGLRSLMVHFMKEYEKKPDDQSDQEWLKQRFLDEMPEMDEAEAERLSQETVEAVLQYNKNLNSLKKAREKGKTTEEWFAEKSFEAAAGMSATAFGQRMMVLDDALSTANAQMMRTVTTQSGEVSQALNLDGFIAEQHHVNSFNTAAAASESPFYAEVCVPEAGQTYGKNSFDVVIRDQSGRIAHQYQFKYGKTAESTIEMIRRGNYNNQTLVVPPEQIEAVQAAFPGKTVVSSIGGTERVPVRSTPFTKEDAKAFQAKVQETGTVTEMNWGSYDSRMLAKFVGKQAAIAGVQGAALTVGFHLAAKVAADEPIDSEEVVAVALKSGADVGVKTVAAGAIKVAAERGVLKLIPPGTPISIITNIACVAIENVKILGRIASGELTIREGLDLMGCNTTAMTFGLSWGATGAFTGSLVLGWIPFVGPIVGGLVGGIIGYMAGSKFGEKVYEAAKSVVGVVKSTVKKMWETTKAVGRKIKDGLRRLLPW